MLTRSQKNEDGNEHNNHFSTLSVFESQGTIIGRKRSRYLTDAEYIIAHLPVSLNFDEVEPYIL